MEIDVKTGIYTGLYFLYKILYAVNLVYTGNF